MLRLNGFMQQFECCVNFCLRAFCGYVGVNVFLFLCLSDCRFESLSEYDFKSLCTMTIACEYVFE